MTNGISIINPTVPSNPENHPNAKLASILEIDLSRLSSLQQGSEEYTQAQAELEQ